MANTVDMLTNWVQIDGTTYGSWYDVDLDGFVSPPSGAVAAVVMLVSVGGQYEMGVQCNGSTDQIEFYPYADHATMAMVKFDGSNIIEHYAQNSSCELYLCGWLRGRSASFTNVDGAGAEDRKFSDDMTKDGSWETITATDYGVESGAEAVIVQLRAPGSSGGDRNAGVRMKGSIDTWSYGTMGDFQMGGFTMCGLSNDQFECAISATGSAEAWIVGYVKDVGVNMLSNSHDYGQSASAAWQEVVIAELSAARSNATVFMLVEYPGDELGLRHAASTDTFTPKPAPHGSLRIAGVQVADNKVDVHNGNDAAVIHRMIGFSVPPQYPMPSGRIS